MGGNDFGGHLAFYGAESGMEKLTSDLSALYTQFQVPQNAQIQEPGQLSPTAAMVNNMTYIETITYPVDAFGNPVSSYNTVSAGANQGLYAEITPMTMQVIATRPSGASVNVTRKVEVAEIPVFQFGVFCGYDCSYFAGPNFSFGAAFTPTQPVPCLWRRTGISMTSSPPFSRLLWIQLENGHPTTVNYGGTVYVPKASAGCQLKHVSSNRWELRGPSRRRSATHRRQLRRRYPTVAGA